MYELFGDKAGLVREVFFGGFRRLDRHLPSSRSPADPRADLEATFVAFRRFVLANPVLAQVMFSRPSPTSTRGPTSWRQAWRPGGSWSAGSRRGIEAGLIEGDETDIAHVLLALAQGLAAQESAGWLGTSPASGIVAGRSRSAPPSTGWRPRPPLSPPGG